MNMSPSFNVAILGFGLSGSTFHAPLINTIPGLNLSHILSRQPERIAKEYPRMQVIESLAELLAIAEIDLVINTLPNTEHYRVSRECLQAGKHLIVEKPFVINSREGEELIQLAQSRKLMLSVYHNRRWDNGFLTLQKILPKLGHIYLYQAYFDRFRPQVNSDKWREQEFAGSGMLYDLGSHLIDQALLLFGTPLAVFADLACQRPQALSVDYFEVTLYYAKQRVVLGSSSLINQMRPTIAAYGDGGSYVKYGLDPQEDMLKLGQTPLTTANYGCETSSANGWLSLQDSSEKLSLASVPGCYQNYYAGIYQSLSQPNTLPPVSANEALNVIRVIEKCLISHQSGQVVGWDEGNR